MLSSRVQKILFRLIRLDSIAGFAVVAGTAFAQTIIPVDPRFPAPDGFSFQGSWKCGDPADEGILKVGKPVNRNRQHSRSLASTWTEIRETDQDVAGNYLVAYDHEKRQFIMIDADDPAYAAYSTDGWRDGELTLTSVEIQQMARHRLVYKIEGRYRFTVAFAVWDSAAWLTFPTLYAARLVSSDDCLRRLWPANLQIYHSGETTSQSQQHTVERSAQTMKTIELNEFRKTLKTRQAELSDIRHIREALAIETSADELDRIQQAQERDYAMGAIDRDSLRLREIRAALERINNGSFGICLNCEEEIAAKRLVAVPWTALCIVCQEAAERIARDPEVEDEQALPNAA